MTKFTRWFWTRFGPYTPTDEYRTVRIDLPNGLYEIRYYAKFASLKVDGAQRWYVGTIELYRAADNHLIRVSHS